MSNQVLSFLIGFGGCVLMVWLLISQLKDATKHLMQPMKPQERAKSASSINFS
jgi:hypothetical protein